MGVFRIVLLFLAILDFARTSPVDHTYNVGDEVPLYVNKVNYGLWGLFLVTTIMQGNLPVWMTVGTENETYRYYDLSFCRPEPLLLMSQTFGEVLNGDYLTNSLYNFKFKVDKADAVLCQKKLGRNEIAKFRDAIAKDYYFQMYYDDLPFWGFIGKVESGDLAADGKGPNYFLFNHVRFDALYHDNQVVEISAFCDPNHSLDITDDIDMDVDFTYSIFWNETSTQFNNRMDKYSRASLLPANHKIHWFSLISSVCITICLMGFSMFFVRHLKHNLRKLSAGDEEEDKDVDWKFVQGDGFKSPSGIPLLCAVLGTGAQLLTMVFILFTLAFAGIIYPYSHGSIYSWLLLIYALTSAVSGFISASFCSCFTEVGWGRSVLLAGLLFLCPAVVTVFILNLVSAYFGAIELLPFRTMFIVLLGHLVIGSPLLAISSTVGSRYRCGSPIPSTAKKCPKEFLPLAWYQKTSGQMLIGGLLPLSAIAPELHLLYASIWGYKISTVTGVLFITFIILILLTALLSISLTCLQLTVEGDEWCWRSVIRGGAVGVFMFLYSILFYWRSNMTGFLQAAFFFGYTACFCYAFFLMFGAVSFFVSFMFLQRIQQVVKNE